MGSRKGRKREQIMKKPYDGKCPYCGSMNFQGDRAWRSLMLHRNPLFLNPPVAVTIRCSDCWQELTIIFAPTEIEYDARRVKKANK